MFVREKQNKQPGSIANIEKVIKHFVFVLVLLNMTQNLNAGNTWDLQV